MNIVLFWFSTPSCVHRPVTCNIVMKIIIVPLY
jgi:hypothetical protein